MNPVSRTLIIVLSLSFMVFVLDLVKKKALKEKYAFLWLITGSVITVFAVLNKLLFWLISLLGIQLPINGVLFLGLFFIAIISIHFSVVISNLSEQNKKIAQKLAILEIQHKDVEKEDKGQPEN